MAGTSLTATGLVRLDKREQSSLILGQYAGNEFQFALCVQWPVQHQQRVTELIARSYVLPVKPFGARKRCQCTGVVFGEKVACAEVPRYVGTIRIRIAAPLNSLMAAG